MVADGFSKTLAFPPLSTTFPQRSARSSRPICDQVTLGVRVMFADREAAIDPPRIAALADRDVARSGRDGGMAGHDRAEGQCRHRRQPQGSAGRLQARTHVCMVAEDFRHRRVRRALPARRRDAHLVGQHSGPPACRADDRARQVLPPMARRSTAPGQGRAPSGSVQPTTRANPNLSNSAAFTSPARCQADSIMD
jgi:hypothetical protein